MKTTNGPFFGEVDWVFMTTRIKGEANRAFQNGGVDSTEKVYRTKKRVCVF